MPDAPLCLGARVTSPQVAASRSSDATMKEHVGPSCEIGPGGDRTRENQAGAGKKRGQQDALNNDQSDVTTLLCGPGRFDASALHQRTLQYFAPTSRDRPPAVGQRYGPGGVLLTLNRGGSVGRCPRRYFGLASFAAFSTALPVAFTSFPAPSTVLQADNATMQTPSSATMSLFM